MCSFLYVLYTKMFYFQLTFECWVSWVNNYSFNIILLLHCSFLQIHNLEVNLIFFTVFYFLSFSFDSLSMNVGIFCSEHITLSKVWEFSLIPTISIFFNWVIHQVFIMYQLCSSQYLSRGQSRWHTASARSLGKEINSK